MAEAQRPVLPAVVHPDHVVDRTRRQRDAELGTDGFRPPRIVKRLVKLGHLGKKSGRGFYVWENGEIVGENPAARRPSP